MTTDNRNYRSFYKQNGDVGDLFLDPTKDGWEKGSWQDTAHFSECENQAFYRFIVEGGTEDCLDFNNRCKSLNVTDMRLSSGGRYCITLKGGSCDNQFLGVTIINHGLDVDIEIGNWSDQSLDDNTGNVFASVNSQDGRPVTYCYRLGSRPRFMGVNNIRHLWWRSIGLTVYWWVKWFCTKLFGGNK